MCISRPVGAVPRAYEETEGRKAKRNKRIKKDNVIENKTQNFKNTFFSKTKIPP